MPEGHVTHRLALTLNEHLAGRPLAISSPQGRFAAEAARIDGEALEYAEAFGKHLFLPFADGTVHVHLGLYGKFRIADEPAPEPRGLIRLRLETADDGSPAYADLRGPAACELLDDDAVAAVLGRLGPDPLRPQEADVESAWRRIHNSRTPIGALLMDQRIFAGVGNIFRAEVLFRQRIHPLREGRTLRRAQFDAIWSDLVELMAYALEHGRIDTVRPEHTPEAMGRDARVDRHGGEVYVYRRLGQCCLVCGAPVRHEELAGRNLFWCGRCQRAPRRR